MHEARLIQSSLLPSAGLRGDGFEIAFRFSPALEVAGDFLDFFCLPQGTVGISIGDVVGKGLPAAMYGALVMGTLRGIHKSGRQTDAVLTLLNQRLMQRPMPGRFCSTLYAMFDPLSRKLSFSNAGLPFPLRSSRNSCHSLQQGGLPSGLLPSASYDHSMIELAGGDSVLFATDGLHECVNLNGEEFGRQCLTDLWAQSRSFSAEDSLEFLFAGLQDFTHGIPPGDDVTALVLKAL